MYGWCSEDIKWYNRDLKKYLVALKEAAGDPVCQRQLDSSASCCLSVRLSTCVSKSKCVSSCQHDIG
jgi:hypothetical protein